MPIPVLIYIAIEAMLIVSTTILLVQPEWIVKSNSKTAQALTYWGGIIMLCLTFCWSVVLGIAFGINDVSIHF